MGRDLPERYHSAYCRYRQLFRNDDDKFSECRTNVRLIAESSRGAGKMGNNCGGRVGSSSL